MQLFHYLKLTILITFVLIHLFNGNLLAIRSLPCRLENDTKGAISDDSVRVVGAIVHRMLITPATACCGLSLLVSLVASCCLHHVSPFR